jgi:predicted Rossmann-fold nucleotide-binding protein
MAAVCVFCASSAGIDPRYLDLAARLGRALGERGHSLVSGGGRVSMMGEVARAARAAGARTVGVIPQALGMHVKPVVVLDPFDDFAGLRELVGTLARRGFVRPTASAHLQWTADVGAALDLVERAAGLPDAPATGSGAGSAVEPDPGASRDTMVR